MPHFETRFQQLPRPPLPPIVPSRPVTGDYELTGISVEVQRPLKHGATSIRLDDFDNLFDRNGGLQASDRYLSTKQRTDIGGTPDPLYNQDFYTPSSPEQTERVHQLEDLVERSGLLGIGRRDEIQDSYRSDGHRGLVSIDLSGRDASGERYDHFVARYSDMPQVIRDVVQGVQRVGDDVRRNGQPMSDYA